MKKEYRDMTLKERFDSRGFGVSKYAKVHGLSQPILSNVLKGDALTKGTRRTRVGVTKKVYLQLKKDDIWIGKLPWEGRIE